MQDCEILSFDRAVWRNVWADFWSGLREKLRVGLEALISFAGTVWLHQLMRGWFPEEFAIQLLSFGCMPFALMALHLLWSWAVAPRRIYYRDQQHVCLLESEVKSHRDKTPRLEFCDLNIDDRQTIEGGRKFRAVSFAVHNFGRGPAENVCVRIEKMHTKSRASAETKAQANQFDTHQLRRRRDTTENHADTFTLSPDEKESILLFKWLEGETTGDFLLVSALFSKQPKGINNVNLEVSSVELQATARGCHAAKAVIEFRKSQTRGVSVKIVESHPSPATRLE